MQPEDRPLRIPHLPQNDGRYPVHLGGIPIGALESHPDGSWSCTRNRETLRSHTTRQCAIDALMTAIGRHTDASP